MTQKLSDAEIQVMKDRIEGHLKEAEEAAFTLEMWMRDWRERMAAKRGEAAE